MTIVSTTETRIASIQKVANDIIIITMKDCGKVDEYDVIDLNLVLRHISNDKPALKLFDARAKWSMDKKAKERAKLENNVNKTKARAVLVSNMIQKGLLSFINSFSKFNYPQQIFTDKEEAMAWLKEQK